MVEAGADGRTIAAFAAVDQAPSQDGRPDPGVEQLARQALSADGGGLARRRQNLDAHTDLDTTPDHTFAYTSIEFVKDRALFTYYVGPPPGREGQWSLKLKAVPLDWFYR